MTIPHDLARLNAECDRLNAERNVLRQRLVATRAAPATFNDIAAHAIESAERMDCSMADFIDGLQRIVRTLQARHDLAVAQHRTD